MAGHIHNIDRKNRNKRYRCAQPPYNIAEYLVYGLLARTLLAFHHAAESRVEQRHSGPEGQQQRPLSHTCTLATGGLLHIATLVAIVQLGLRAWHKAALTDGMAALPRLYLRGARCFERRLRLSPCDGALLHLCCMLLLLLLFGARAASRKISLRPAGQYAPRISLCARMSRRATAVGRTLTDKVPDCPTVCAGHSNTGDWAHMHGRQRPKSVF